MKLWLNEAAFSLPTRKEEAYRYTDFSRIFPKVEWKATVVPRPSQASDIFGEGTNFPLARFALEYETISAESNWENRVKILTLSAGEEKTYRMDSTKIPHFQNEVYVIYLAEGSRLRCYIDSPETGWISQHLEVVQAEGSVFEIFYRNQKTNFSRYDLHVLLKGRGAKCRIFGAYQGNASEHQDHHIHVEHWADETESEQFFKGILDGQARAVFNGKATVHEGVQHAKIRQYNANLLLSAAAEIDTKPELEIFTDVVQASHGATVGQVDEDALHYLRMRGLSESLAMEILTEAFLEEVQTRFEKGE